MRVAILIDELAPGSAPKVIGQTYKGLEKLGHKCEALVLIDNRQQEKFSDIYNFHLSGVKIRYIFGRRPSWDFRLPGFSFFSLHHILSFFIAPFVIKYKEYDIIIANAQSSALAAWSLKLFRNIPYIFYIHCDPCTYTLKKTYLKTWLRIIYPVLYIFAWLLDKFATTGAIASITSGKLHRKRFSKISNKPLENLRLGCFLLDTIPSFKDREKAILTYDRWDMGNKPNIFLDLLENLKSDIRLKLGGFWHPESIKKEFIEEAKKRKMLDRIDLLGPLDEKMIMDLCSKVMLHIHPNEEAFGMQTLEAAACGCPIIIPQGSGVADLFEHGRHGYFPKEGHITEFVKFTDMIFSDLKRMEQMSYDAWNIAKKYTWQHYAEQLEVIVKKYLN